MKKNIYNSRLLKKSVWLIGSLFLLMFIASCDTDVTEPEKPSDTSGLTPVITSVNPPDSVLAGITEITITGSNFSTEMTKNIVYFDNIIAKILQVSANEMIVKTPKLVKDSVQVKIAVQGVEDFSSTYLLHLKPAVFEIFGDADNSPSGVTFDDQANLYFNLVSFAINEGIKRLTPAGVVEDFANKGGSFYLDLKYGRNGKVYGARSPAVRAIFANSLGANPAAISVPNSSTKFYSLDIDNNYNIWTGGTGGEIYRITEDEADKKAFPFEPEISAVRFYNGYLYAAAKMDSTEAIYRIQVVSSDSLGTPEVYFDVTTNLGSVSVNAITFAADGRMFLGTDAEFDDANVLIVVNTDGSFNSWYPGVITGPIASFAWDEGDFLYYIRKVVGVTQTQMLLKINMVTQGAPYYGRD